MQHLLAVPILVLSRTTYFNSLTGKQESESGKSSEALEIIELLELHLNRNRRKPKNTVLTNTRALKEAVNFYGDKQPKLMRFDATRPAREQGQGKIGKATKTLESLWITTVNHKDKTGGQIEMTWLPFLFLSGFTQTNNNLLVIFSNPPSNSHNLYRYLL